MASESEDKKEGNKEDNGAEASRPNDEDVTSTNSEINSTVNSSNSQGCFLNE